MAWHWKKPKNKENLDGSDQVVLFVGCYDTRSKQLETQVNTRN